MNPPASEPPETGVVREAVLLHKPVMNGRIFRWLAVGALAWVTVGETVKDREGAVRQDAASMSGDARWIYNDVGRGFEKARNSGKPVLVVLRCVPCLACGGLDGRVIDRSTDLAPLLDEFVCVRVINANALDLSRFQFDYDLSFSALLFNGDGTLYGRFGSWTHQTNAQDRAVDGFRRTLEGALKLHRGYPGNRSLLEGKQGSPVSYRTPVDLPTLAGKYRPELDWKGKVVPSCVHCHQIGDAYRTLFRERGEAIPSAWIYPQPAPETLGFRLMPDQTVTVETVTAGSSSDRAGLRPGDDVVTVRGQPVISVADVRWALHGAPESGELTLEVMRGGQLKTLVLELPPNWRRGSDISRRVGTWEMRAMALGGLLLEDLPDPERTRTGMGTSGMALRVKHAGEYGRHSVAKRAGVQKDDVLVGVDGLSHRMSESELIGHLLQAHRAGDTVRLAVQRGDQRLEILLGQQ